MQISRQESAQMCLRLERKEAFYLPVVLPPVHYNFLPVQDVNTIGWGRGKAATITREVGKKVACFAEPLS